MIVSSAIHAPTFEIEQCDGPILQLLECDSLGLLGTEWRRYVHKDDWPIAAEMERDMLAHRGGQYHTRSTSTSGDRFHLVTHSYVDRTTGRLHTRSRLADIHVNRVHVPMKES